MEGRTLLINVLQISEPSASFPKLNFPVAQLAIRQSPIHGWEVNDRLRKKWLVLTPEEWVRQHVLAYLIDHLNYPAGLVAVEAQVRSGQKQGRLDVLCYNLDRKPHLLVECKAPAVPITADALFQLARYTRTLQARFLVATNGLYHSCFEMLPGGVPQHLETWPVFNR